MGVDGVIGVTNNGAQGPLVNAPGNQVLSTSPANQYDFFTGSSFATAQVSGVTALIRSGRLRSVTQGRTRLIPANAISDYIALLERESGQAAA